MRYVLGALAVVVTANVGLAAAQQPQAPVPPPTTTQTPAVPEPAPAAVAPATPVPGTVTCPAPVPPAVAPSRAFTAPAGILLHQVIPSRISDFEKFLAYVREALAKTTNPTLREQAKGWQMWRAVEAGPNGDAMFVFVMNPAVPCLDYALMPILSDAYPDPAQLTEIYKLYQSSVRPMGTALLNLVPIPDKPATPPLTPPTTPPEPAAPPPSASPLPSLPAKP